MSIPNYTFHSLQNRSNATYTARVEMFSSNNLIKKNNLLHSTSRVKIFLFTMLIFLCSLIVFVDYNLMISKSADANFTAQYTKKPDSLFTSFTFGCSGREFKDCPSNAQIQSGPWVMGSWTDDETNWLQNFSSDTNANKIPLIYNYIIAGMGRADWGLADCNVNNSNNLCQNGANYVRSHVNEIKQKYLEMAQNVAKTFGTTKPILLYMEPDYYQYYNSQGQQNPLSMQESWNIMNTLVAQTKNILPNAYFVMDVSPWASDLASWAIGFRGFDFGGLVGRQFPADGENKTNQIDGKTYAELSKDVGMKLIVDTSFGVAGVLNSFDYSWTPRSTLQILYPKGVVAVLEPGGTQIDYYTGLINSFKANPVT